MHLGRVAVATTWVAAAAGVVVVLAAVPGLDAFRWLALTAGLAVAVGIAGQLAVADRSGFVLRLAAASVGAFVLVAIGALLAAAGA
ncbi:hypothetical protein [Amnibacterium endophyticum]|uniref:Uncharacterized protein n=1 Tax=Amnibacterium endophyticum TaxID=2109337 RepID=A0ABW4LCX6_9MICO